MGGQIPQAKGEEKGGREEEEEESGAGKDNRIRDE